MANPSYKILWSQKLTHTPQTALYKFTEEAKRKFRKPFRDYNELHRWSTSHFRDFWKFWLEQSGIIYEGSTETVATSDTFFDCQFFPDVKLNFAENLLKRNDDHVALINHSESRATVSYTYRELRKQVEKAAAGLKKLGVKPGDRVAAIVPNIAESAIAMLATTSLGAVWSSCSPDFGVPGLIDRFSQIQPKILIATNGTTYGGKTFNLGEKIKAVREALTSLEHVIILPLEKDISLEIPQALLWEDFLHAGTGKLEFSRFPWNHPVYILYSSGTTGVPKCIVHGAGGTLLQHTKELILHSDLQENDHITYYTTCGWMMWNWLMSSFFTGCTVTLFDGSPSFPTLDVLWDLIDKNHITHFGTSARYLTSCRGKVAPKNRIALEKLRVILSTGSPLLPEDFDWVYSHVKTDVQLSSISGGTDIISCFLLGNPLLPVYRGELQCKGLGMDVAAFNENLKAVVGEKGELVCLTPFPSMPVCFWNDADQSKYKKAYFHSGTNVWFHGDFIEFTESQGSAGGAVIYGRSDATLNPGGVRIGTAEIYRLVETVPGIDDSLVVGQPFEGDVRVLLFVKLNQGTTWSPELEETLKKTIRTGASPRHVPAIIRPVEKIPYTMSGKKVELAVVEILTGKEPKNRDALIDPTALDLYKALSRTLK